MKRILVFDGEKAARRFELCRVALIGAGNGKGDRTREVVRAEARLLDALDVVSHLDDTPTAEKDARVLNAEGGTVTVSQADHDVLSRYADTTPWLPRVSREAVDLQDWLSAAEKIDV